MTRGEELRAHADKIGMPLRTLAQVQQTLKQAAKTDADAPMARLMIWHGRLTEAARRYVETAYDPHAICRKWVKRFGLGFHPDTRGKSYDPPLSEPEVVEYDEDMRKLFGVADDPYECGIMAWADAGLIP